MVAVDRRLDLLTSELTARERAIIALRAWAADEKTDERLDRFCPPQDRAAMERIISVVQQASAEAHNVLVILLEWTAVLEQEVKWLRVFRLHRARTEALERVARKPVADLPSPPDMGREVRLGWGRLLKEEDEGPAPNWDEFHDSHLRGIERGLCLRWRDVLSLESTLGEVSTAMGEPMVHADARRLLDALCESVMRLHRDLAEMGIDVKLPEDSEGQLDWVRETIEWDVLRPKPPGKQAREWMHPKQQEALEAFEREHAEALRKRS